MATLQELRTEIDRGKTAVLFLPHDHPENYEQEDVKIFICRTSDGLYQRRLVQVNMPLPEHSIGKKMDWRDLIVGSTGIEATTDQWVLMN